MNTCFRDNSCRDHADGTLVHSLRSKKNFKDRCPTLYRVVITIVMLCASAFAQLPPTPPPVIPQIPQIPDNPNLPPDIPQISGADTLKVPEIPNLSPAVAAEVAAQPAKVVPAAKQLYIVAAKETAIVPIDSTLARWTEDAAQQLNCVRSNGFQLAFEGLWTILSYDGRRDGATTNAEDLAREARECFVRYADDIRNIKEFRGSATEARQAYDQMIQNLRIDWNGNVASYIEHPHPVHLSRGPEYENQSTAAPQQNCHSEDYYTTEKVPKRAGFDAQDKPYYEMHWDVVKKTRTACE